MSKIFCTMFIVAVYALTFLGCVQSNNRKSEVSGVKTDVLRVSPISPSKFSSNLAYIDKLLPEGKKVCFGWFPAEEHSKSIFGFYIGSISDTGERCKNGQLIKLANIIVVERLKDANLNSSDPGKSDVIFNGVTIGQATYGAFPNYPTSAKFDICDGEFDKVCDVVYSSEEDRLSLQMKNTP